MKSLPSGSLYIRITDEKGRRRYEPIRRRNPQMCGPKDIDCLHFYEKDSGSYSAANPSMPIHNCARSCRFFL